ncbi:MAG: hypothetical protein JWP87_2318 [Labilithrix sp.]|nr:hypothetical protein [Labilithrix sp.]
MCGAFAIAVTSACSLATSLNGLSTGDTIVIDGGGDAAPGADAQSGPDAGSFSCAVAASTVTFCADLEDGKLPIGMNVDATGGGTVTVAPGGRSSPNALTFMVPETIPDGSSALNLQMAAGLKDVVVELDLRVESYGEPSFDIVDMESGTPQVGFQIESDKSVSWDEDILMGQSIITPVGASLGDDWRHVRLEIHVAGASANANLFLDGTLAGSHVFEAKAFTTAAPTLNLGDSSYGSGVRAWKVRVDNFTVDAR